MSNNGPSTGVGRTLAGGVQDVAATLPLIGTEQCEKHTGSALKGGYLYAAAAPLSIFGSLGIVKAGIAIVTSSISIPISHLSFSFRGCTPSVKYSLPQKWLGGRMLKDAGFELTGVVAPLIGMDGDRFRAETRLMEMLEEKHIDDLEKIVVEWKSRHWNIMLVLSTILGAALSFTPYIALLGPVSWRPNGIHIPWVFPALRIVGSCIAANACQFIIQFRVISLMKNRILFMIIHRQLKDNPDLWQLKWDENLPAEQCIWSLEQYLSSGCELTQKVKDVKKPQDQTAVQQDAAPLLERDSDHISIAMLASPPAALPTPPKGDTLDIHKLHELQREHFPTPTRDAIFTTLLWILLAFSLPATVAGYIGCFTLVGATPTQGNGPLVWVGLEATLSILRIFIWACNPSFDEQTDVTLRLELSDVDPIFPTEDYNPFTTIQVTKERKLLTLVPEREFLERMTPFTGPLDQFPRPNNLTLYFTLISNYDSINMSQALLVTVFDLNMQLGVSFGISKPRSEEFDYWEVTVKYDTVLRKFHGHIQSEKRRTQPWRLEDDNLFASLQKYHQYVFRAFAGSKSQIRENQRYQYSCNASRYSILRLRWDISTQTQSNARFRAENPINTNSQHVDGIHFEYQSKTKLIIIWASWIVTTMGTIQSHTKIDCHGALKGVTSQKGIRTWELAELDTQLVWEWTKRELVLLTLSLELEDILRSRMETCADNISHFREDKQLKTWIRTDFEIGWQKRMEQEREAAKQRMERAMTNAHEEAEEEGQLWQDDCFSPQWTQAIEFIERQWSAGINNGREGVTEAEDELKSLMQKQDDQQRQLDNERYTSVEHKKRVWHEHWRYQHRLEEDMMKAAAERIRTFKLKADSIKGDLDMAYHYPLSDRYAAAKFVRLKWSSSRGMACTGTVYDAGDSGQEAVCNVIAKSTTRSVINVNPKFVASIPPNDHLLFLQSRDLEAEEPAFVKRNRDRWWDQQIGNASMFYFSPEQIDFKALSCQTQYWGRGVIAHIFVFLTGTTPSAVQVGVLLSSWYGRDKKLSIQENGQDLQVASISKSDVSSNSYQLENFQSFVLQPGRHELELYVHHSGLGLRDIFITLSEIPSPESDQGVFATIQDPHSEESSS